MGGCILIHRRNYVKNSVFNSLTNIMVPPAQQGLLVLCWGMPWGMGHGKGYKQQAVSSCGFKWRCCTHTREEWDWYASAIHQPFTNCVVSAGGTSNCWSQGSNWRQLPEGQKHASNAQEMVHVRNGVLQELVIIDVVC